MIIIDGLINKFFYQSLTSNVWSTVDMIHFIHSNLCLPIDLYVWNVYVSLGGKTRHVPMMQSLRVYADVSNYMHELVSSAIAMTSWVLTTTENNDARICLKCGGGCWWYLRQVVRYLWLALLSLPPPPRRWPIYATFLLTEPNSSPCFRNDHPGQECIPPIYITTIQGSHYTGLSISHLQNFLPKSKINNFSRHTPDN